MSLLSICVSAERHPTDQAQSSRDLPAPKDPATPFFNLVCTLLGAAYFEASPNAEVIAQIMSDIYTAPRKAKEKPITVNGFLLEDGQEHYNEAVEDFLNKETLAAVKECLQRLLDRVEDAELGIEAGAVDKNDRKRVAEDAIERHVSMLKGLSKRLKTVKDEDSGRQADDGEESQELGTIMH